MLRGVEARVSAPVRMLRWDGCVNVRDLGGYSTHHGRSTRFGSVVRADNPSRLSPRGWQQLRAYGVRTVIGLRTVGAVDDEPADDQVPEDVKFVRVVIETSLIASSWTSVSGTACGALRSTSLTPSAGGPPAPQPPSVPSLELRREVS